MAEKQRPWTRPKPSRPPGTPPIGPAHTPQPPPMSTALSSSAQGVGASGRVAPSTPRITTPTSESLTTASRDNRTAQSVAGSRRSRLVVTGVASVTVALLIGFASVTSNRGEVEPQSKAASTISPPDTSVPSGAATASTVASAVVEVADWEQVIQSVAAIEAECPDGIWGGSGVVVLDGSYILTNYHVAEGTLCRYLVCFTDNFEQEPVCEFSAEFVVGNAEHDLAVLRLVDQTGRSVSSGRSSVPIKDETPPLGSELTHIGYPGLAGLTLTLTVGRLSGLTDMCGDDYLGGSYFKTDATGGPGMSGGGVFNSQGEYVGTHTAGCNSEGERGDYSLVRPAKLAVALLGRVGQ
jgi:S1-C subfamily serine protease